MIQTLGLRNAVISTLILMAAHAAAGQPTDKVRIILGTCTVNGISVVLNGEEGAAFSVDSHGDPVGFVGRWKKSPEPFPIKNPQASLRLGGKRTDCQPAKIVKDNDSSNDWGYLAQFTFKCDSQPVRNVHIQSNPPRFAFRYVRWLAKSTMIADSRDCNEWADFEGTGDVVDLRLDEKFFLKFRSARNDPGLYVHEILGRLEGATPGKPITLSNGTIVQVLSLQRAQGNHGSASNFSTAAIDIDERHINGLTSISLDVK